MENILKHHGVLGMRWGRRKSRASDSSDHKAFSEIRKKKLRDMTDEEIKVATKRMRLVKAYRNTNFIRGKKVNELSNKDLEGEIRRNKANITVLKTPLGRVKLRDVRKMNDEEIKSFLNRAVLEKEYKTFSRADITASRKLIKEFLNANQ